MIRIRLPGAISGLATIEQFRVLVVATASDTSRSCRDVFENHAENALGTRTVYLGRTSNSEIVDVSTRNLNGISEEKPLRMRNAHLSLFLYYFSRLLVASLWENQKKRLTERI